MHIRQKKWKTTTFKETNRKHTANRLQNTLQENNRDIILTLFDIIVYYSICNIIFSSFIFF